MARQNFGGFGGGGGNMQQLMRQAQKLHEQMAKVQEDLDKCEYEASSGGGMVTVKVSGTRQLLSISIDEKVIDPEEKEMLEDMVMAAVNEALAKGEKSRESEMSKLSPGMGGMF